MATTRVAVSAPEHTFHVDAASGDDGRDGLKPESAWRSLAKVNRARLTPGDRVLFRRGQQWRGQLVPQSGDASGTTLYGAFGEGNKPLLLGSVAVDHTEEWQPAGEGIWATAPLRFEPVGVQSDLPQERWALHQEAGASCTCSVEKHVAGDATALRLNCLSPGTRANHLQLSFSGLTVQEGEHYLFTFRAQATRPFTPASVSLMKNGPPWTAYATTETALPAIGTNWAEYTIRFRARQSAADARLTVFLGDALVTDTTLLLLPEHLMKVRCNQPIPLSVDVGNIIFDHGKSTGVKKWSEAELRQDDDYYYDARSWQVKLRSDGNPAKDHQSIELALRQHIIDQSERGYVTYENLDLRYGAAHGIGGGGTHHITVRGCDISYIGGGHQTTRPDGKPVRYGNGIEFWSDARHCVVEDCRIWEVYDAALTNQGDGTNVQEDIAYRRNVIWNSEYSFEYWNRGPASRTRDIVFEHNTCVDAGQGWGHRQRPDPNGCHLMFYDNSAATTNVIVRFNLFCGATDHLLRLHGRDWTASLMMDYNCWFQPRGPWLLWGQRTVGANDFAAFMHPRNLDLHSLLADPKFVDAARRDYLLAPDSPARAMAGPGKPAGALPVEMRLGQTPKRADAGPLRVIIETDAGGDPDDEQSLVRFLVYANEFDIEGIIANRPVARDGENQNPIRDGLGIVRAQVKAYGECRENLIQHDPRFPTAAHLLTRTVAGYDDTDDGVKLIIQAVDADNPRPVWFCNWGTDQGSAVSCLKRALDLVRRERGPGGYAQFKSRLRLSSYDKFGEHTTKLEPLFPLWVDTFRPQIGQQRWYHRFSALTATAGGFDLQRDVRAGHGPLGVLYPVNTGPAQKEGDTMSFLYLVPTGMNDPNEPGWGSWGGRYGPNEEYPGKPYFWANQVDAWRGTKNRDHTLARWAADLQNDFRARMDWCVKSRAQANHRPVAVLNGQSGAEILRLEARSGGVIALDAAGSSDPDGNTLTCEWLVYGEAGTYRGETSLSSTNGLATRIMAPEVEKPETIHIILRLQDDGQPPLCGYRRAVVAIRP